MSSLKKQSKLLRVGGLWTLKQIHFLFETVTSLQKNSLDFGSIFFSRLHIEPFVTNSKKKGVKEDCLKSLRNGCVVEQD